MTPLFHSSGDSKIVNKERHSSFGSMILWNYVRMLVLKMAELERMDAPVGPLTIVAFLSAVTTVILRGMLGESVLVMA